jgi:predicted NAD-dependent protein-ADP-ribosyltransferase YbiA (DUF1768 family)
MIKFTKVSLPYGWLGNMAPFPVMYKGKKWLTIEALFQALRFEDEKIIEEIRLEKSPMGAKMKAKKNKLLYVIEPMSEKDLENMRMCVRLKLEQHPKLVGQLLATNDQLICEDIGKRNGERHKFWGAKEINGVWEGENMMGKIWMELRNNISITFF